MRPAGGQSHARELGVIGNHGAFWLKLRSFHPCTAPFNRAIQNAGQWLINHAQDALAFDGESDLYREVAVAIDKSTRAVERIDHPHPRLTKTAGGVYRFFGQDTVVGKLSAKPRYDQLIRKFVSLSYWFVVVRSTFCSTTKGPS